MVVSRGFEIRENSTGCGRMMGRCGWTYQYGRLASCVIVDDFTRNAVLRVLHESSVFNGIKMGAITKTSVVGTINRRWTPKHIGVFHVVRPSSGSMLSSMLWRDLSLRVNSESSE
jgi:hypothetical protein